VQTPTWILEIAKDSPYLLIPAGIGYGIYKIVRQIVDSPLSIATFFASVADKERREDARQLVELLCNKDDEGDPPAIQAPLRRRPRNRRRGKRRRGG
jgi:hypothetical protein